MAGGIYIDKPFSPNIKCIIFASLMVIFYWISSIGKTIYWLFPLIFIISYIALAWYDAVYNCSDKLYSGRNVGVSTFDSIFKPQLRGLSGEQSTILNQEKIFQRNVYLFHLLLVAPLLLYMVIAGYRGKLNKKWFIVLSVIVAMVVLYHGYRFFRPRQTCNIVTDSEQKILDVVK